MPNQDSWQLARSEYIRQGEPDRAEKSAAWQTAIGLQAVDGLKTSPYGRVCPADCIRMQAETLTFTGH